MNNSEKLLQPILQFLNGETPDSWINEAKKTRAFTAIINRSYGV